MEFSKKIYTRLITIILTSISILIIINLTLISYSSNKASEFIGNSHYNQIINHINGYSEILKASTDRVANSEKIINLLYKNRDVNDFSEADKALMESQIEMYESMLQPITYIKTINVLSVNGQYLFSNGVLYDEFDIRKRPWFNEDYLTNYKDSIITDVHKDFSTGQHTISVIKFIYSQSGELLGAASLDIFVEDLLNYINTGFYLGTLNSYVDIGNGNYISKDGIIDSSAVSTQNTLTYSESILDGKITIMFMFDKNSMIYSKQMKSINNTISIVLIVLGLGLSLVLVKALRLTFKPIMNSLDKLKLLLKNLEKNNFDLELSDEFEQLELISESLSKSFDKKIQSLIYYDELTSLPNRKMLFNFSNELIKNKKTFALLFIDLNNFKYVNDIFGHSAGDELLSNFSKSLQNIFIDKGLVTRYSGDEFVVVYDNYTTDYELLDFYNNVVLNEFVNPIYFGNNNNILVKFSAGVAIYPRDGKNFDDLIRKSDFMMYSCKKTPDCNNLLFFNDAVYNKLLQIEDLKLELKNAIEKDEFLLYYQPIVAKDSSINKVEALIRWKSEKFGFISPADFINYAEEIGEIIPIGYWIIEEVCRSFGCIHKNNINLQISINVSPIQLMSFDFAKNVEKIVRKYDINFKNLCFEITESVVLDKNIIVYDNLHLLHKLGASIALDDFGTGYSSFSYLRKYKLDILKIDRMFIDNDYHESFEIVENIKNIAHLLNMTVVIEGVETKEQFGKLSNIGCDYFQGYYFSKPVSFEELKKMLF